MLEITRTARAAAMAAGALILSASTFASIHAARADAAHASLAIAVAAGVFAGACCLGAAWRARRRGLAIAIALALLAGEAFGMLSTADRIVAERDRAAADIRAASARHAYAVAELARARDAMAAATNAATSEAAKPGCKQHCRAILEAGVANAARALDDARQLFAANPKPAASGSPLADRLGVAAWAVDLALASLLSVGANGLAAALVAFGAHGGAGRLPANDNRQPGNWPQPPRPPASRKPAATGRELPVVVMTKGAAEADVVQLVSTGAALPSQDALAARWHVHKSSASRWVREFEQRGLVRRDWDGRCNQVRAAS